jgi:uncharacterized protein DUF6283
MHVGGYGEPMVPYPGRRMRCTSFARRQLLGTVAALREAARGALGRNTDEHRTRGDRTVNPLPRVHRPCDECPFRRDALPGRFPACRYEALTATAGTPGHEAPFDAPMFACHKTPDGQERACAGWLAVAGFAHLGVRLAVLTGRLDPAALAPGQGWPELYGSYQEVAAVNGCCEQERD